MKPPIKRKNPGWLELLLKRYQAIAGKEIALGFPKGACQAYPDGEQVAQVAASHVYGIGVPIRDFMTYADPEIKRKTRELMKKINAAANRPNSEGVVKALSEAAGLAGAQAIKDAILEGDWVPNSPKTIAKKKSDKPLIDTAHMIQSVTYVVRDRTVKK